tara:strand:- start:856 stop:1092 length:237 start_codon:yes stop_codon:yes gene_type:complete
MEYKCETSKGYAKTTRRTGDPVAVKFTDDFRFVGLYGGNSPGVSITLVGRDGAGCNPGEYTVVIAVADFLAIARSLKG